MNRSLASIQTIKSLENIAGKDRIKLASFESVGFKCIVSTGYNVGDKVVYFEMDSLIPATLSEFEFLRSRCYKEKYNAYHIKCMKMAGTYSEGLAFKYDSTLKSDNDGDDLTEHFGVKKYDPEAEEEHYVATNGKTCKNLWLRDIVFSNPVTRFLFGRFFKKMKGYGDIFKYIGKSDQTRYQSLGYIFDEFEGIEIIGSIKMDGQSMTVGWIKGKPYLASRNVTLNVKSPSRYKTCAEKYNLIEAVKAESKRTGHNIIIQGESCGEGIQGNKYCFKHPMFFLYDVKDATTGKYYSRAGLEAFSYMYSIPLVPECYRGEMFSTPDEMQDFADSMTYDINGKTLPHEGVVFRLYGEQEAPRRGMSNYTGWKVISTKFNEKYYSK